MDNKTEDKRKLSRRDFLKGVPAGIAGALAVGALLPRIIRKSRRADADFPEDSIFSPADRNDVA